MFVLGWNIFTALRIQEKTISQRNTSVTFTFTWISVFTQQTTVLEMDRRYNMCVYEWGDAIES